MKRIGKEPTPTDLGLKMLNERIAALTELKTLCDTDEFRAIATILHQHGGEWFSTPSIGDKEFYWNPYLTGLERWHDPKLTTLLDALINLEPDEQDMKEFKESYNRDYKLVWKFEDGYSLRVSICAYEKSDTAECRKIQVGTKMVEQPIYRYDCVAPEGNSGELPPPVIKLDLDDIPF